MKKLYKFEISAPTTANRVKSLEFVPSAEKGSVLKIYDAWISFPDADAIATGSLQGFQISTVKQDENTALLNITDKDEVFTWEQKFILAAVTFFGPDINKCIHIPEIAETVLACGQKYFLNAIITGQDAADVECHVKLLAEYQNSKNDPSEFQYNVL